MSDTYLTLEGPATGEFKDRGSKFIAYAFPINKEEDISLHLDAVKKEHLKARHHCYAWRMGREGIAFRANDDGEPSGTAGRPILGQIDSAGLTDTLIIVVRYFGGTLLGTSGLIQAYRGAAQEALAVAPIKEVVLQDEMIIHTSYAQMPDVIQAIHKTGISIRNEAFDDSAHITIAIRQRDTDEKLLELKSKIWKTSVDEAVTLDWPEEVRIEPI